MTENSFLPTLEFLEDISKRQWSSIVEYAIAFSEVVPLFHSTTNSEWICLNSESELLDTKFGTVAVKKTFDYITQELSPVFVAQNSIQINKKLARKANSIFLYRINGDAEEIILNSNYPSKTIENQTTAPLLDSISRECLLWFDSTSEYFTGFGVLTGSLVELVVDSDGVITSKSDEILSGLIPESVQLCPFTSIQVINETSTLTPYVSIQFSTRVEYLNENPEFNPNILFLFSVDGNNDTLVSFAKQYPEKQENPIVYDNIIIDINWVSEEIVII